MTIQHLSGKIILKFMVWRCYANEQYQKFIALSNSQNAGRRDNKNYWLKIFKLQLNEKISRNFFFYED